MLADLANGGGYLVRGFRLIGQPGLRRFVAVPAVVNTVLFAGLIALGFMYFDQFLDRLLPDWLNWLAFILWPLFALAVLIMSYYTFTLVANLVASPFNERLSRKVAEQLGAPLPAEESDHLALAIPKAVANELHKWLYFAGLALIIVLIWLFPLTTLLSPILWPIFGAWMMAVEYGDYPMGPTIPRFSDRRAWLRRRRWLALGFGGATLAATLVPVLNFLVMPAAVAGATAMWVDAEAKPETS